ncbi:MAG: CPBP family intramembrane metalloprotease [Phaeodactylibacter sp.]|nr:CPBP family intramembrane metalloprotease [Phaeodactylibacter sp.]
MKNIRKTTLFLLLTFGISYTLAGVYYLSGAAYPSIAGTIMAVAYMFVPTIAVLLVEKVIHKTAIRRPLLISFRFNRWFLAAWLLPPAISLGAFGIALLFPGVSYSPGMEGMFGRFADMMTPEQMEQMRRSIETLPVHPFWLTLGQGLIAGITINAVAGFGEELGWRGFLLNALRERSFLQSALLIGFIWGIWHAPLILMGHNYPEHPWLGILMMIIWGILLTPLFLYITVKTRSVIAAAILHGTLNGTAGMAIMMIEGGSDLLVGVTGLAGFLALVPALLLLYAYDRWGSRERLMGKALGHGLADTGS